MRSNSVVGLTGSTGFIGSSIHRELQARGTPVVAIPRMAHEDGSLRGRLDSVDVVIHAAGLVHRAATPSEFDAANHVLTKNLCDAATSAGVRRFVLVSSISAAVRENDYAKSKIEAEDAVLSERDRIEVVVARPPLVYGPKAKANFKKLVSLCDTPMPLPFGSVRSRRSMVGLQNLTDALLLLALSPDARPGTYNVTDGDPLTLLEIVCRIREALGRQPRLFNVPPGILRALMLAAGRGHMANQLLDDLVVDDDAIRDLGWRPPREAFDQRGRSVASERPSRPIPIVGVIRRHRVHWLNHIGSRADGLDRRSRPHDAAP